MTRRERLENRVEKREEWAQKRTEEAKRRFRAADEDAECFYGGQPILVGHHSEKRARKLQEKIHRNGFAGVDNMKMAEHHANKAEGLREYLDNSIFSDDEDAVEKLEEKISRLEHRQAFMIAVNKICRNKKLDDAGKMAAIMALGVSEDNARLVLHPEYSWQQVGFASFELTNNNANIRRCKKRLEQVKRERDHRERAEASEVGYLVEGTGEEIRITFPEKPEREIIAALKAAGFRWSRGSWYGKRSEIPSELSENN